MVMVTMSVALQDTESHDTMIAVDTMVIQVIRIIVGREVIVLSMGIEDLLLDHHQNRLHWLPRIMMIQWDTMKVK